MLLRKKNLPLKKKKAQKADPDTEQLRYLQSLNVWKRKVDSFARGNYRIHAVLYCSNSVFRTAHPKYKYTNKYTFLKLLHTK